MAAWEADRNAAAVTDDWQFATADARVKLKRPYPVLETVNSGGAGHELGFTTRASRLDLGESAIGVGVTHAAESPSDDFVPIDYRSHRRGYVGRYTGGSYASATTPSRFGVDRLAALCAIHAQFRGRFAYRRRPAWEAMRAAYRALPAGLSAARWGLAPRHNRFWSSEIAARAPRPRPHLPQGRCTACALVAALSRFEEESLRYAVERTFRCPDCGPPEVDEVALRRFEVEERGGRRVTSLADWRQVLQELRGAVAGPAGCSRGRGAVAAVLRGLGRLPAWSP